MEKTAHDPTKDPAEATKPRRQPRKWFSNRVIAVIVFSGFIGLALGYFAALTQPFAWKVEATLLAHVGRESGSARSEIVAAGGSSHVMATPSAESLNTEINLLKSPELLRATWKDVKDELQIIMDDQKALAEKPGADSDAAAGETGGFSLMGMLNQGVTSLYRALDLAYEVEPEELKFAGWSATLQVAQIPRSNMLLVTATSPSPKLAKLSLERWLKLYQDTHIAAFTQEGTRGLFDTETKRLTDEVRRIEGELTTFRLEHDVPDIDAAKKTLLNQKLGLDDQLLGLETQMKTAQTRLAEVEKKLEILPERSLQSLSRSTSPTWDLLDRGLVEAEEKLKNAEIEFRLDSPNVRRAREMRDVLAEMIKDHTQIRDASKVETRDPIYADLERDKHQMEIALKADAARKEGLQTNLDVVRQELKKLEELRPQHNELLDELSETRRDLAKFKDGARIARLNSILDDARVTNVKIVSPPSIPSEPIQLLGLPHRLAITGLGGAMGVFAALGIYLLMMSLREAGLLRQALTAAAASRDTEDTVPDYRELGVWAIADDDDDLNLPPGRSGVS